MAYSVWSGPILIVFLGFLSLCFSNDDPQVCISNGCIKGSTLETYFDKRTICSFRGIFYSEKPERFKDSEPKQSAFFGDRVGHDGVFDGTKDGDMCVQRESPKPGDPLNVVGNENCLTVSVYTPTATNPPSNNSLPVFVFFHPGAWVQGDNREAQFGPEFFGNYDVVFVTVNYRLDVFGFHNLGDDVSRGNYGFRDQVVALQWVQKNIAAFGGNPDQVTLIGEATGGSSCTLHLQSPLSQGLFKYVIAMSGTSLYPSALKTKETVANATRRLAQLVGCSDCESQAITDCMRNVPADTLISAQVNLTSDRFPPFVQKYWGPTLDYTYLSNATFPGDPRLADGSDPIPLITGSVFYDGTDFLAPIYATKEFEDLVYQHPKFYLPLLLNLEYIFPSYTVPTVFDRVYSYYFQDQPLSRNLTENIIQMFTDYDFFTATMISALRHAKVGAPTWYYIYNYVTPATFNDIIFDPNTISDKPGHGDNLLTLFPLSLYFPDRTYSDTDKQFINDRLNLWVNFASSGNPNTGSNKIQWNEIGTFEDYNVIVLDSNFRYSRNYRKNAFEFWIQLIRTFAPEADTNF